MHIQKVKKTPKCSWENAYPFFFFSFFNFLWKSPHPIKNQYKNIYIYLYNQWIKALWDFMAWGRINEHRKNLVRRFIKVISNAKSIDEKTRVKSFIPIPWLYEFYFPFLWVLLSFNKWYVISIIKHGAHWQEKLCRKTYKSRARLIRFFTWSKVQKNQKDLLSRIMGST